MKYIMTCFFLFSVLMNYGQRDTSNVLKESWKIGFNGGYMVSETHYELSPFAYLTLQKKKHTFGIGPVIDYYSPSYDNSVTRLNTIGLVHQYAPHPKSRVIDFYLSTQLLLQKYKFVRNYNYFTNQKEEVTVKSAELTFGYGLKIKFLKRFYFNSFFGVGYYFRTAVYAPDTYNRYTDVDRNVALDANFGLGYGF